MIKYYLEEEMLELKQATEGAGGYDVYTRESFRLLRDETHQASTGLYLALPTGVVAMLCSRSGLARKGVVVANAPGIIDSDYRGEVFVNLRNFEGPYTINAGDRIAQLVFVPTMQIFTNGHHYRDSVMMPHFWKPQRVNNIAALGNTVRGEGGHGSTGA